MWARAVMERACIAIVLLLASAGTAHAQLGLRLPEMVAYRDPHHGSLNGELTPLATSLVTWDGQAIEGTVGGGLAVAAAVRGGWPDWHESSEWAVEVRVLATHVPSGGPDIEVPIDLIARWGAVSHSHHTDTSGWPTEVYEPLPWVPYVGLGLTLDVSTQHGLVRPGPVVIGGVHWWLAPHFGIVTELEVRALFGDVRPVGQLGGSLGVIFGV